MTEVMWVSVYSYTMENLWRADIGDGKNIFSRSINSVAVLVYVAWKEE